MRTARLDLGGSDYVDGLRDFDQRRIGLGTGSAAFGDDTVNRSPGIFLRLDSADACCPQLQGTVLRDGLQRPATLRINRLQATSRQQAFQTFCHVESPLQPFATLARGELCIHRQQNPGVTGKAIQDLVEATASNGVLTHLIQAGVFGNGQARQHGRGRQQRGKHCATQNVGQREKLLCRVMWHSGTPHENAS